MTITEKIFRLKDEEYKEFQCKLMPTVNPDSVIGVRIPHLRKLSKEIFKTGDYIEFLHDTPHRFYEENNLHAFIIEQITDYAAAVAETKKFLPFIDNWATCDMFMPKCFKNNSDKLLAEIKKWIKSQETYTVRFGVGLLMKLFLDDKFDIAYADLVSEIDSQEYYVKMMQAWYFATALSKHYYEILPYLTSRRLSVWVHNKTIQKAVESKCISEDRKDYLKTLKLKSY